MKTVLVAALFVASVGAAIPIWEMKNNVPDFHGYTKEEFNLTALDDYIAKPDDNYAWNHLADHDFSGPGYKAYLLNITSQRWLTDADTTCSLWWHYMVVIVPFDLKHKDKGVVYITGNGNDPNNFPKAKDEDVEVAAFIALNTGTIAASLFQIPNEACYFTEDPVHQRRSEDAIIAYTWNHFIKDTTKPEWLLRLPMTKAVVRAMDAMTDFVKQLNGDEIASFGVAGASKRGWTTWTTAAADKRVFAAIPIVMSALNFVKNIHHYWRAFGGWTFAFSDYMDQNFTQELDNPNIQLMADIIDPLSYKDRLTMPLMQVATTGDEFFMPDDENYYWSLLPSKQKHMIMLHNAEHSCATGIPELLPAIAAFLNSVLHNKPVPQMTWNITDDGTIQLHTEVKPSKVVVHYADTLSHERRDFRLVIGANPCPYIPVKNLCIQPVLWHKTIAQEVTPLDYTINMGQPEKGWRGFFMQVFFEHEGIFRVDQTTSVSILPKTFPFPDCHGEECRGTLV